MATCSFSLCKDKSVGKFSMHRFPKIPKIQNEWIRLVQLDRNVASWRPSAGSRICATHFHPSDFCVGTKRLISSAVPSQLIRNYVEVPPAQLQPPWENFADVHIFVSHRCPSQTVVHDSTDLALAGFFFLSCGILYGHKTVRTCTVQLALGETDADILVPSKQLVRLNNFRVEKRKLEPPVG